MSDPAPRDPMADRLDQLELVIATMRAEIEELRNRVAELEDDL